MADDAHPPAGTPLADRMRLRDCAHGRIWVHLLDERGKVIAAAALSLDVACTFASDLFELIGEIAEHETRMRKIH